MVLAILPLLVSEFYNPETPLGLNYGLNRVRFPAPVPGGSRIRVAASLISRQQTQRGRREILDCTVELVGSAKPACRAEAIYLFT